MRRKIKFHPDALHHIYSISLDGGVIFYNAYDYVVFFTIMSVCARRYNLGIEEVCIMRNHFHLGVMSKRNIDISRFMMTLLNIYAREYNSRSGVMKIKFKHGYGRADKLGEKERRSCIIYIVNNGVEKKACSNAMEYRWNFLKYMGNAHPYSHPIIVRKLSLEMKKAISIVNTANCRGDYIRYSFFEAVMPKLRKDERLQLIDYIISKYNIIEYERMMSHFKDVSSFFVAVESSTGKEFDVGEEFVYEDYRCYDLLENIAKRKRLFRAAGQLIVSENEMRGLEREYIERCGHVGLELGRFLHRFSNVLKDSVL